jgi:hypothetical protein
VDIGAHFSYVAQKGMAWGFGMCERLHCSLGFVIEGQVETHTENKIACSPSSSFPKPPKYFCLRHEQPGARALHES